MKKLFTLFLLSSSVYSFSQVGINTNAPKATLDVVGNPTDTSSKDGVIAPRLTGDQLRAKSDVYGTDQTGAIVYATAADSSPAGKTVNVTSSGYYYFDGSIWQALKGGGSAGSGENIYNADGTLTANRTVTQADKTIKYTGSKVDGFNVGSNALSVDMSNSRLGVNTNAPTNTLDVNGNARIRDTKELESTDIHSLYIDESGLVGIKKSNAVSTESFSLVSNSDLDFRSDFNAGNTITLPLSSSTVIVNTINAEFSGDYVLVKNSGVYQISASVNKYMSTSTADADVYVALNVQSSTDNGSTWTSIAGVRPIITVPLKDASLNFVTILPTNTVALEANTLIRFVLYRTKNINNTLQGSAIKTGIIQDNSAHGTVGFNLSINKL